ISTIRRSRSEDAIMTDDTIHTCSYECERPGCIRAQRDELVAKVEKLRAEVEAWRELSDHVRVGACKAIWPDRYVDERIRDVAAALKRAERLAAALRLIESAKDRGFGIDYARGVAQSALLRDQEEGK